VRDETEGGENRGTHNPGEVRSSMTGAPIRNPAEPDGFPASPQPEETRRPE
jgi:hypothetical protein